MRFKAHLGQYRISTFFRGRTPTHHFQEGEKKGMGFENDGERWRGWKDGEGGIPQTKIYHYTTASKLFLSLNYK